MGKRKKYDEKLTAPMRVLLDDKAEAAIKSTFSPQVLAYNLKDFEQLWERFREMDYPKSAYMLRIWNFIGDNSKGHESMRDLYETFDSKTKGKAFALKRMFLFIFHTPLDEVPLYVNHQHLSEIARWRLLINK